MAIAAYNASGADGLPAITPGSDALLLTASVETLAGEATARVEEYLFPGLDGRGAVNYGVDPAEIAWLLTFTTVNHADRIAFENKLRQYLGSAKRFTLTSETGEQWNHVELRSVTPVEAPQAIAGSGGGQWRRLRIVFRWQQPGAVSAQ